jgi:hypothetical protein
MPGKQKDYNELELETIAALRAEGHDSFEEMVGPLRRRMAEKTGRPTRLTPWLFRFTVVMAGLAAVGLLIFVKLAG